MMDLTTINKNSSHSKGSEIHLGKIVIISSRQHVVSGITTQLRMNGSYDFVIIDSTFTEEFDDNELTLCEYTIIDIESFRDVAEIERKIKFLIPVTIKKIFVGDIDSISFYNEMKRIGVAYLHLDSQMMQLGSALKNIESKDDGNIHTQKISILGCKGGSGASLVSWWFFQAISTLSHLPILLVQGHTGSPDLDLISDIAIQRDGIITPINAHQALKISTEEEQWHFDDPNFKSYNIIIFDYNVTTQVRDKLAVIVPGSDFIFVVVTRELSSVRNARLILDELERNSSTNSSETQTISKNIIILNDKMPAKADELSNEDIENYLGRKIDIFSSFQKDLKKNNIHSDLYDFAAKMLGKDLVVNKGRKKRNFSIASFLKKK
ncbi:hypothetical protein [Klebsiella spallanzanii]|uniref:hypothetical protein n=1 Tax=Klebsiella spallanzanii TaxID=2587528 RepID=UPI001156C905|nr:hypothetical protein [Klebsiella spallanzanii]VUS64936.1 hypothetical protein SB6419_03903 [Klebsiella spallanzanii]